MPRSTDAPGWGPARRETRPRVALVTANKDRHARDLLVAFRSAGADVAAMGLSDVVFDSEAPAGLVMPHFGTDLPDAVCVRTVDGGSFEQVTRRLGVLHALQRRGVHVSNDAGAIERCVDKSMTSFLLSAAGLPSPRSHVVESRAEAARVLAAEGAPMVLKPLFGSQGNGLRLVSREDDLPPPEEVAGVYYLQRFAGRQDAGRFTDYRILVSGGRACAGMMRRAASWITNIKQGADACPMVEDPEMADLAVAAAAAVGADFCGVDLLRDPAGRAQLIEVNSMPAWTGLEQASGIDIAALRVRDLLSVLERRRAQASFRAPAAFA